MHETRYPKEQMHRRKYTKLTREQIDRALVPAAAGPSSASQYSPVLVGRSLKIVTDGGPVLSYTFRDERELTVAEGDAAPVPSGYGTLTLEQVVLFSHMVPKTQRGYSVVVDLETSLATVFEVWFSGYKDNREVQRQMYYGYVEVSGKEPPKQRHHLTNRLEGKGFHWTQDTGIETLRWGGRTPGQARSALSRGRILRTPPGPTRSSWSQTGTGPTWMWRPSAALIP